LLFNAPVDRPSSDTDPHASMPHLQVLVVSAGLETGDWLAARLCPQLYEVRSASPGADFVRVLRERRPDVAVIDGIHARPAVAPMEVALLKDRSPGVQIIALSDESSVNDAAVVEQGVFCYLAGCSRDELLRVVQAATVERSADELPQP
jgi:DNA-binding NtrC family response regulator